MKYLEQDNIYCGYSETLMKNIPENSIALSVWSPSYHVGKDYESGQSYEEWLSMLSQVISLHHSVLKPGGFLVINILVCFNSQHVCHSLNIL